MTAIQSREERKRSMAFDFKKEYKELYLPKRVPELVRVPTMNFVAVRGQGDPNEEDGAYKQALEVLYAIAYTIKMSKMGDHRIDGYFDFVVPPLEGFWWQPGQESVDFSDKSAFHWISAIRLPDFVTPEDFAWAQAQAAAKKGIDASIAELLPIDEGVCVQAMHLGPYDDEPATIALMDEFAAAEGYVNDMSGTTSGRHHHEIYLSDPRRTAPDKLKTIIRHPVKPRG